MGMASPNNSDKDRQSGVEVRHSEIASLRARCERLEEVLRAFVLTCDSAPPIKLLAEISARCGEARAALADEKES